LSHDEIISQTALLLLAGQETTANTLALGIRELARNSDFQNRLRDEINAHRGITSGAQYEDMPLLNAFIKETLRVYPAVPLNEQIAVEDTFLPLTTGITTISGEKRTKLPIRKGQMVTLALASYQRLESIWGSDAHEFKPNRWIEGTACTGDPVHGSPYSNLLCFFSGPRTCLGY
ncbi:cytochrome P450, partial [Mycena rebaudengoi]